MDGSPAQMAGLKAHDSILEIDGSPIKLDEGITAVNRVQWTGRQFGEVEHPEPGQPGALDQREERGKLASTGKLETYHTDRDQLWVYAFPPLSYSTLADDVTKSLQSFTANRTLDGVILDLRIAGSTSGWPLEPLYTTFYDGTLGEFYNRDKKQAVEVKGQDVFGSQKVPLIIFVGQNTTGFPEFWLRALNA